MLRFLLCSTILAASLGLGCGSASTPPPPPDAGADAAPRTNVLEVEGPERLALVYGEEAVIAVRYLGPRREPLAERVVSFAFDGRAHDSTLRSLDVQTDETGFARTTLVAGSTPAAYRVRVTAEDAAPAFVDVSVSDEGFGQLSVEVRYDGSRPVTTLGAAVFAGLRCDDETTRTEAGDRYGTPPEHRSEVLFLGLPAGLDYAVVARGEGPTGELLAWGCVDGVAVEAAGLVETAVTAQDLPQDVRGSYETTLTFEPSATAAQLLAQVEVSGEMPLGDGTSILDAVARSLRAAGDTDGLARLAEARTRSDADAALDDQLTSRGIGPSAALDGLYALLDVGTQDVELRGSLRFGDAPFLHLSHLAVGPPDSRRQVEASVAGGLATELSAELDPVGETLRVELLSVDLRASAWVAALAATMEGPVPAESSPLEGALRRLARCEEMPEVPELAGVCDAACLANACSEVMKFLTMDLELRLGELDNARSRITARGELALRDDDADLEVDRVEATLDGEWTGDRSPEPEPLEVNVQGDRVTPPS